MKKLLKTTPFLGLILTIFLFGQLGTVNAQSKTSHIYIKIEINGMVCSNCAFGMEKELKKVSSVADVQIQLKEGLAYIATLVKEKPLKEELALIITKAGFTAGKIEFSDTPFAIKETLKK